MVERIEISKQPPYKPNLGMQRFVGEKMDGQSSPYLQRRE